ncbi:MAG TPA: carbamate kinase [Solirubrobacteraceae bacterium]|nr:carbamate kinase [Solirubrobacteraceae bacterium]
MRIVAALGGNALLERGEPPDSRIQLHHVRAAVEALAPLADGNDLVITHGNGPQVGLLALESAEDRSLSVPYPFDVLGAETQGMIGYWILQALQNALPGREVAALITQTLVSISDPAFAEPTKFVGPVYEEAEAKERAAAAGWIVKPDGPFWRRVVPSPAPCRIVEIGLIRQLFDAGVVVICAGGGGVPVIRNDDGALEGAEAVVDKDATAALLAGALDADALLLLTDVATVEIGYGTPDARPITGTTPAFLRSQSFPSGSMGPKVDAVCRFVELTGGVAAIGALADAGAILSGSAGTLVFPNGPDSDARPQSAGTFSDG